MSTNLPKLRAGKFGVISIDTPDLAQSRIFCDVLWLPGDIRQAELYAEEVVRAVNSHTALLEACQQAEHWLTEEAANPGEATPDEILRVLRAAIGNADSSATVPATDDKSAASELFDALQALTPPADLGEVDLDDEDRQHLDNARAVLAKWEGKL